MTGQITDAERKVKLAIIAGLRADEIDAYEASAKVRGYFDGELAALMARYRAVAK